MVGKHGSGNMGRETWVGKHGSANPSRHRFRTRELSDGSRVVYGALMLGKLLAETFLRVRNSFHNSQGDLELAIAASANSNSRGGPEPFRHSKITFWHALAS